VVLCLLIGEDMLELGDMIHWHHPDENDIGWVVHIENRAMQDTGMPDEWETLIYIKWLFEDSIDHIWEHTILEHDYMTITKGGQHDR